MPATANDPSALRCAFAPTDIGLALVAADDAGIAAVLLGDDATALRVELQRRHPAARLVDDPRGIAGWVEAVAACLDHPRAALSLPLAPRGTPFQQRVWQRLRAIPPGHTTTYAALARELGTAARAVGQACGANPIAVLIPCHRVLAQDGGLGGYRWGLVRKRWLLTREGVALPPP